MRALVHDEYGGVEVLRVAQVPIPEPRSDEVLVRVHAASINEWDNGLMHGTPIVNRTGGLRRPAMRILGSDMAGVVESVGPSVTRFAPGDEVFGDLSGCGFGAFAEFVCAPESALMAKPTFLSFAQAAAVPQAGGLAMAGLRMGGPLLPGQRFLMNGGGGGVGTFAIQVAKVAGVEVTAVDGPSKLEAMRHLGSDRVVDFTRDDFSQLGEHYDLILDVVCHRPVGDYRRALRPGGTCAVVGGSMPRLAVVALVGPGLRLVGGRRVGLVMHRANHPGDMARLVDLMEHGPVRPVIDHTFPLTEAVAAMRRYVAGDFVGKICLEM
jgi:NADPH:quinone reductase-like Zn-dependent oxidoreductase